MFPCWNWTLVLWWKVWRNCLRCGENVNYWRRIVQMRWIVQTSELMWLRADSTLHIRLFESHAAQLHSIKCNRNSIGPGKVVKCLLWEQHVGQQTLFVDCGLAWSFGFYLLTFLWLVKLSLRWPEMSKDDLRWPDHLSWDGPSDGISVANCARGFIFDPRYDTGILRRSREMKSETNMSGVTTGKSESHQDQSPLIWLGWSTLGML